MGKALLPVAREGDEGPKELGRRVNL